MRVAESMGPSSVGRLAHLSEMPLHPAMPRRSASRRPRGHMCLDCCPRRSERRILRHGASCNRQTPDLAAAIVDFGPLSAGPRLAQSLGQSPSSPEVVTMKSKSFCITFVRARSFDRAPAPRHRVRRRNAARRQGSVDDGRRRRHPRPRREPGSRPGGTIAISDEIRAACGIPDEDAFFAFDSAIHRVDRHQTARRRRAVLHHRTPRRAFHAPRRSRRPPRPVRVQHGPRTAPRRFGRRIYRPPGRPSRRGS